MLIITLLCGWTWGSGYNEGDLEMRRYSIVGDYDEGIKFDPDNDGDDEIVMNADGSLTIDNYTLPYVDRDADQVLTTDGLGNVTWQDGGGSPTISFNTVEVTDPDFTDSNDVDFDVTGSTITLDVNGLVATADKEIDYLTFDLEYT